MSRSRYRILQSQHPHFLTCTVLNFPRSHALRGNADYPR